MIFKVKINNSYVFRVIKMPPPKQVSYCSPSRYELGVNQGTCLTKKELENVAKEVVAEPLPKKLNKTDLHTKVSTAMKPKCGSENHEICWIDNLRNSATKERLIKAYRPRKPKSWLSNPRTWLNTYDILFVMRQYEDRYKNFKFLGVHPIDFMEKNAGGVCVGGNMCDFSIKDLLAQGKKRFGLVLNLDDHRGGGFHWVAIFCVFDPKCASARSNYGIYYYDSVADPLDSHNTHQYTAHFMKNIERQVHQLFPKTKRIFEVRSNSIRRQYKGTECGVFSQVFITQMLKNIKFDEICKRMPRDDDIQKLRDILYSPS